MALLATSLFLNKWFWIGICVGIPLACAVYFHDE